MNILVCMKAVPSTGEIQVDGQFRLRRDGAKLEWNIADQAALEAALQLKGNDGNVTVITMGLPKLEDSLRELLARGADRAILVTDPAFAGSDTIATAFILSSVIRSLGSFDLILCGRRAIDGETGQVPPMLAAAMDIPCVTNVDSLSVANRSMQAQRRLDAATQQLEFSYPAVVTICEYSYCLRLPGILGMRRARSIPVEILRATDLNLSADKCGLKGSLTKVIAMDSKFPGLRRATKESDISVGVKDLISFIKEADQ